MGMALSAELGEDAYSVWENWSRSSENFKVSAARSTWKSFGYGSITIATLFHAALKEGWRDEGMVQRDPEETKRRMEIHKERMAEEEAQKVIKHQQAAAKATQMLADAALVSGHPYLKSKQMPDEVAFVLRNMILVPMRNIDGLLVGLQVIGAAEDGWEKKFIGGTKAKEAFYTLGNKHSACSIMCEGYATGLSILAAVHMFAMDVKILVCFSSGNIASVSRLIKGKKGVYADNDVSKAGEDAAKKAKLPYIMSDTVGFDANDDMREYGVLHVAEKCRQLVSSMGR
jgi:putative DNA primase/helicase